MALDTLRPWITWAALAFALAWSAHRARALRPWPLALPPGRQWAVALAVIAVSAALSLVGTDMLPVHDHNTFVARADHAWALDDRDPRRGWNPPAFHLWHLLLHLAPYRLAAVATLGVAVTALAHALLYVLAYALCAPRMPRAAGGHAALWTLAFASLHPVAIRLAAGSTFWPLPMALLFAAGIVGLLARETRDTVDAIAAAVFLALAALCNEVFLVLLPLAALVGVGRGAVASSAVALALAAPYLPGSLRRAFGPGGAAMHQGPLRSLVDALFRENLYLDPRITPVPVGALLLVGVVAMSSLGRAAWVWAYALVATEYFLAPQVSLFVGYPTRFIQGSSSTHLLALAAGVGAAWLTHRGPRVTSRTAALVAVIALAAPWTRESWRFVGDARPLGAELRAISSRLPTLPTHDVLVLPPTTMARLAPGGGDPVEAYFPVQEYLDVMASRGMPVTVVDMDHALSHAPLQGRVLVYVSATTVSFLRAEIAAGAVPTSLERPELTALRARYTLTPASVFTVSTRDHPAVTMRLAAGRRERVTLGFCWLQAR